MHVPDGTIVALKIRSSPTESSEDNEKSEGWYQTIHPFWGRSVGHGKHRRDVSCQCGGCNDAAMKVGLLIGRRAALDLHEVPVSRQARRPGLRYPLRSRNFGSDPSDRGLHL